MRKFALISVWLVFVASMQFVHAKDFKLLSPSGEMTVKVEVAECIRWSVYQNGQCILAPSAIDLELQSQKPIFSKLKSVRQQNK